MSDEKENIRLEALDNLIGNLVDGWAEVTPDVRLPLLTAFPKFVNSMEIVASIVAANRTQKESKDGTGAKGSS